MSTMASQTTNVSIVYSTVYSGTDQRKHQNSASLAFVRRIHRWLVNSPHKGPVTWKMFPFDDVIMFCLVQRGCRGVSDDTCSVHTTTFCWRQFQIDFHKEVLSFFILIWVSLNCLSMIWIEFKSASLQVMTWYSTGDSHYLTTAEPVHWQYHQVSMYFDDYAAYDKKIYIHMNIYMFYILRLYISYYMYYYMLLYSSYICGFIWTMPNKLNRLIDDVKSIDSHLLKLESHGLNTVHRFGTQCQH